MDYPKFSVSNQKEESISIQKVKSNLDKPYQTLSEFSIFRLSFNLFQDLLVISCLTSKVLKGHPSKIKQSKYMFGSRGGGG